MRSTRSILYRGPSLLDPSKQIVVLYVGSSNNSGTGDMPQTFILEDEGSEPHTLFNTRELFSVCGDCRHARDKSCYVSWFHGPLSSFRSYHRGNYQIGMGAKYYDDRTVRMGAAGDPAAVPVDAWEALAAQHPGHLGYTHQWKTCDQSLQRYCMASVDSIAEMLQAQAMGWRTFRVRPIGAKVLKGEADCPKAHTDLQCKDCKYCDGTATGKRGSVSIAAHGPRAKRAQVSQHRVIPIAVAA